MKEKILSNNAPNPIGPYSQAIQFNNMIFISGQIAINPKTNLLHTYNIEDETKLVMENIKNIFVFLVHNFNEINKYR